MTVTPDFYRDALRSVVRALVEDIDAMADSPTPGAAFLRSAARSMLAHIHGYLSVAGEFPAGWDPDTGVETMRAWAA